MRSLVIIAAFAATLTSAHAQSPNNGNNAWGSVYQNPGPNARALRAGIAATEHPGGGSGGGGAGGMTVNGDFITYNTYNGPVTDSGVTNVGNMSSTETSVTASGGSSVTVSTSTDQKAKASQKGTASANGASNVTGDVDQH